jgi:fluoroacetyl-CoA thioesterase
MKRLFKKGDKQYHRRLVKDSDLASFDSGKVHPVCSTFVLAREMEWASRLFVIEMLDDDEEGIGTRIEINHLSPALAGEVLEIVAMIRSIEQHEIICDISVFVGDRLIARGMTGQKILPKTKVESLISSIKKHG